MEEIDLIPKGTSGQNFGWPCFEGTVVFDASAQCVDPVAPLIGILHSPLVCAVIGGVVVRDPRLPDLAGRYLYGDYCGGHVMAAELDGTKVVDDSDLGLVVPDMTSFGVDASGRVYVMNTDGSVYRIDPRTTAP